MHINMSEYRWDLGVMIQVNRMFSRFMDNMYNMNRFVPQ